MWPSALSDFYTSIDKQLSREMENDKFSRVMYILVGVCPSKLTREYCHIV